MKKILVFIMIGLLLVSCSESKKSTVFASSVKSLSNISLNTQFNGVVIGQNTQEIKKEDNKEIKEIVVKVGQTVAKGDVLFRYDSDQLNLEVSKAQLEIEKFENEIKNYNDQIAELEKQGESTPEAKVQISEIKNQIDTATFSKKSKQSELDVLIKAAQNADVVSEIDGVVTEINDGSNQNQGNPSAVFMKILQQGNYKIKATASELDVATLSQGAPVLVTSRVNGKQYRGTITTVETNQPQTNDNNNNNFFPGGGNNGDGRNAVSFPFYVALEDSSELLLGQHTLVELVNAYPEEGSFSIPLDYIKFDDQQNATVYIVDENNKAKKVTLEGTMNDNGVQFNVTSGITLEDYLVYPTADLKEGMSVVKE